MLEETNKANTYQQVAPDTMIAVPPCIERNGYQTPTSARLGGFAGTMLLGALALAAYLVTWTQIEAAARPSAPLVVNLLPPASPPAPRKQVEVKPKAAPPKELTPPAPKTSPTPTMITHSSPPTTPPASAVPAPLPAQQAVVQASPRPDPAPPAPQPANNAPDSWEGRVLARIAKYRRYPASARSTHEQGVAFIHFRMDRSGHVLSASLARSSGFADLDQAALDTLRRADPLPPIPADRPDQLELSVPIEFYIR